MHPRKDENQSAVDAEFLLRNHKEVRCKRWTRAVTRAATNALHSIFCFESNQAQTLSICMHVFQAMDRQCCFIIHTIIAIKACMVVVIQIDVSWMSIRLAVTPSALWRNDFPAFPGAERRGRLARVGQPASLDGTGCSSNIGHEKLHSHAWRHERCAIRGTSWSSWIEKIWRY